MDALHHAGHSIRQIGKQIGKSTTCIHNCIKRKEAGVEIVRSGRPRVTSEYDNRRIIRAVSNKTVSARKVKHDLQLNCSPSTIRNIIKASGHIVYAKKVKKPILSGAQCQTRVDWCRLRQRWNTRWQRVVFSDEKKFNLDGPDGNRYYYHDTRKQKLPHDKRHSGGGSVMVWGAIGWRGKSDLAFLDGKQNSEKYQTTLNDFLLPCGARIGGDRWKFMQDNAPIHASASTTAWLNDHDIRVLPWPARSPDLNPIENMWGKLAQMVYANGKQYDTINELKVAITQNWANIGADYRHNLYNSMQNRVLSVIEARGVTIKY